MDNSTKTSTVSPLPAIIPLLFPLQDQVFLDAAGDPHTNTNVNDSQTLIYLRDTTVEACVDLMAVLSLLIIFLNSLVIFSVLIFNKLRSSQDLLLANQAVCDLLVGVVTIPCVFLWLHSGRRILALNNMYFCIGVCVSLLLPLLGVLISMFIMTLDRYIAIVFPYAFVLHGKRIMRTCIGVMWTYVLTISAIPFVWHNEHTQHSFHYILPYMYVQIFLYLIGALCILLSVCMNIHILYVLNNVKKYDKSSEHGPSNSKWRASMTIYALNLALWLPQIISGSIAQHTKDVPALRSVVVCFTVSVFSSVINPLVYAKLKKSYRNAYIALVTTPPWKWSKLRHRRLSDSSFDLSGAAEFALPTTNNEQPSQLIDEHA